MGVTTTASLTVSIVSHGHHRHLAPLLADLNRCPEVAQLILTLNIPEPLPELPQPLAARTTILHNATPRGFAANHNRALASASTPFVAVLNPDLRLPENPFPPLVRALTTKNAAIVSPAILNPVGDIEDHARRFPTLLSLFAKALGLSDGRYPYAPSSPPFYAEWVAAILLVIRRDAFAALGGFDARYHLYYEDVDLCLRAWRRGLPVLVCPEAQVIHAAQRTSHRHPRYLLWHLQSLTAYLVRHSWRLPKLPEELHGAPAPSPRRPAP